MTKKEIREHQLKELNRKKILVAYLTKQLEKETIYLKGMENTVDYLEKDSIAGDKLAKMDIADIINQARKEIEIKEFNPNLKDLCNAVGEHIKKDPNHAGEVIVFSDEESENKEKECEHPYFYVTQKEMCSDLDYCTVCKTYINK